MTLDIKQLKALADAKIAEGEELLAGDAPDMEKAAELEAEAEGYLKRVEAMTRLRTLKEKSAPAPEPTEDKHVAPLVITRDEADGALEAKPFKSFGEFLMTVKNAALNAPDQRLLPLLSRNAADEGGFSINGALGDDFVGGLTKSAFSKSAFVKQTGLHEGLGATGGFLVGTDRGGSLMERVYDVGNILQRVDMVGISANSNGMSFYGVNETSRADGSRRGGIRAYWTAEGGAKTASQPAFRKLELNLNKVVGLVYATDELLEDASALESWIMQNLPEELVFVVEDAIIRGTGKHSAPMLARAA